MIDFECSRFSVHVSSDLTRSLVRSLQLALARALQQCSAVALHCCKAHAKINRKMGNSTPVKS